ncbi:TRAP transporter small permease [Larsenimonas rhizosphaerae]|uniref:TRAP transporter small permease n=1 Tax=Larsenimonas rhizosphaerae TaxID=2944682 RepID=UPI002033FD8B|nr:TRAP transporter small permease [Larsenimonas rhizosphaerae]MCM2131297.1 TRAP transporter small permease [Larsenimonas rhizosphaerae]
MHALLRRSAIGLALMGGGLLLCAIGLSLVSLVGRKLWAMPVPGDIEVLQMLVAVAVACFLPLCEINDHHIRVDILASLFPSCINRGLMVFSHLMLGVVSMVLLWRTALMMLDSHAYASQSTLLGVPLWIPQAAMLPGLALMGLCALSQAARYLTRTLPELEETA